MWAVCMLMLLLAVTANAGNLKGVFTATASDGATCKWFEGGSGTKTLIRSFRIVCNFPKNKKKQGYECTYKGNPHDCAKYNKDQAGYYQCLADDAAGVATACTRNKLFCDQGKFKKCGGVKLSKQSSLKHLLFKEVEIDM